MIFSLIRNSPNGELGSVAGLVLEHPVALSVSHLEAEYIGLPLLDWNCYYWSNPYLEVEGVATGVAAVEARCGARHAELGAGVVVHVAVRGRARWTWNC